MTQKTYI